jgi:heat shock protein HtpX
MNILALGRTPRTAKLVMTTSLIENLTSPEAEAVFAHELAHIQARDTAVGVLTTTVVGIFPFSAEVLKRTSRFLLPLSLLFSIFSPLSALFMHLSLSPKREFEADAAGVLITRYPEGLYTALEKLGTQHDKLRHNLRALAHLWIVDPSQTGSGNQRVTVSLTHPKLEERVKILQSM